MSEKLRIIVQELNKEPFNKNLNLISFDSLSDQQLLQLLNDVFAEIDPKQKMDIREEEPDMTAIRMLGFLRILKYQPPIENMNNFRHGLVQGTKEVIYPLLEWLLARIPDLKNRAYLAKYLMKIDIPPEILADGEVVDLYQQYEDMITNFKVAHKDYMQLTNSGFSTNEIRRDINNMEDEKEQLQKRIEKVKRKVDSIPRKEIMLEKARNFRLEREKEQLLFTQKQEQRNAVIHAEQKIASLTQQLKDLKQAGLGASPEALLQRLEEEVQMNTYIVKQKIPKEVLAKNKSINNLHKVAIETNMTQAKLSELKERIQNVSNEINQMIEKRMMNHDPADDKLMVFRQQAAMITKKKEAAAEKLDEVHSELSQLDDELKEKQEQLNALDNGGEILRGEEFKRYVNKLRGNSTVYKKKRQELSEMKAENGVLSRTEELLKQKYDQTAHALQNLEEQHGVTGYREAQEELEKVSGMKSTFDDEKSRTLEEISVMVNQLNAKLAQRKAALAPLIKDLRPLREMCENVTVEYDEKKATHDSEAASWESKLGKIEQEVKNLQDEITSQESRYHTLNAEQEIAQLLLDRSIEEMKTYTNTDATQKKKSLREKYTQKIQEQERLGKTLREQQKHIKETFPKKMQQMKMWKDLQRLYECKQRCFERLEREVKSGTLRRDPTGAESNIMVL